MSIAEVSRLFTVFSGVESAATYEETLLPFACSFVQGLCTVAQPNAEQTARLEMLSAAYAFKLWSMCADDGINEFTAGDVSIKSAANLRKNADDLWNRLTADNSDIIGDGSSNGFLFGRVVI